MKKVILWLIIYLFLLFLTSIPKVIGNEHITLIFFEIERAILISIWSGFITNWIIEEEE